MVADLVLGFAAGVVVATVTAPVGVSGAVFMLPIQLSVLGVPNPAVTPTNLLYNVVASPASRRNRPAERRRESETNDPNVGSVPPASPPRR